MTTRILRVGNMLTVEIPEELVVQAELPVGEPVEWVPNGSGGLALVKQADSASTIPRKRKTLEEILEGQMARPGNSAVCKTGALLPI